MAKISESTFVTLELTEKEFKALKKFIGHTSQYIAQKEMQLTEEEYHLVIDNLHKVFKEVD